MCTSVIRVYVYPSSPTMRYISKDEKPSLVELKSLLPSYTAKLDLIATEMLAFPSKSSRNENDSNLMIAIS